MQLFYQPGISQGAHYLSPEESKHCIRVLRKHLHDPIDIVDGIGNFYKAIITDTNPKQTQFEIAAQTREAPRPFHIHLAVAPTKRMERMEWLVEKATELGVDQISFLYCDHSERHQIRLDRLHRKAISAMKQSIKASIPQIETIQNFSELISALNPDTKRYLAHLSPSSTPLFNKAVKHQKYCVVIGPEGDFSTNEIQIALNEGFQEIQLGQARLRTETAALAALITLHMIQD